MHGSGELAARQHSFKLRENMNVAVRSRIGTIHKIRAGKIQPLLGNLRRIEPQQRIGFCAEISFNFSQVNGGGHDVLPFYSRFPLDNMPPAAVSTSQSTFPFFGWSNCAGNCSGSYGPSRTPLSARALSAPVTM